MFFGLAFFASVFRLFAHQTRHLVSALNMENDQRIKAHLLRWFPAYLEKIQIFGFSVFDRWHSIFQTKEALKYAPSSLRPCGSVF